MHPPFAVFGKQHLSRIAGTAGLIDAVQQIPSKGQLTILSGKSELDKIEEAIELRVGADKYLPLSFAYVPANALL